MAMYDSKYNGVELDKALDKVFQFDNMIADVLEDGMYFVDSAGYIGVKIDNGGLSAINLPTFNNY